MHMNRFVVFTAAGSALCRNKNSDGALIHTSFLSATRRLMVACGRAEKATNRIRFSRAPWPSGVRHRELSIQPSPDALPSSLSCTIEGPHPTLSVFNRIETWIIFRT